MIAPAQEIYHSILNRVSCIFFSPSFFHLRHFVTPPPAEDTIKPFKEEADNRTRGCNPLFETEILCLKNQKIIVTYSRVPGFAANKSSA